MPTKNRCKYKYRWIIEGTTEDGTHFESKQKYPVESKSIALEGLGKRVTEITMAYGTITKAKIEMVNEEEYHV